MFSSGIPISVGVPLHHDGVTPRRLGSRDRRYEGSRIVRSPRRGPAALTFSSRAFCPAKDLVPLNARRRHRAVIGGPAELTAAGPLVGGCGVTRGEGAAGVLGDAAHAVHRTRRPRAPACRHIL